MMGKWTTSHNASPPNQYGVATRETPGPSEAGEKRRQPVWGQVWLAEPWSHRGACLWGLWFSRPSSLCWWCQHLPGSFCEFTFMFL